MAKTILTVDDSATLQQVVAMSLNSVGYEVLQAGDGRDALDKLGKLGGTKNHLIVCDGNMPNRGGIEFVTEVKKSPAYKFPPVIRLTAEGKETIKERGRAAGAKAWIVKPFNPTQLLNAASKLILP